MAALVARLLAAGLIALTGTANDIAPDSRFYLVVAERAAGLRDNPALDAYADIWAPFVFPTSVLLRVFGSHLFLGQLVSALYGAVAAAATTRLAREILPRAWAVLAGGIVALYPSQVLWSSIPLRESAIWAITACLGLAVALVAREKSIRTIAALGATMAVLLFFLARLRPSTCMIAAVALLIMAVALPRSPNRLAAGIILGGVALFVPPLSMSTTGVAGINKAREDVDVVRAHNAEDATSSFASTEPARSIGDSTRAAARGLEVVLVEPLPVTSLRGHTVRAAQLESPLWWLLIGSATTAFVLLWRNRAVLGFPALYVFGVMCALAIAEGNFGTLYRHRGQMVWPMAVLSAAGLHRLWMKRSGTDLSARAVLAP